MSPEERISSLLKELNGWTTVDKLNLPPHPHNPYAKVKNGSFLSNNEKEKETVTYTIYWDGSLFKSYNL